MNNNSAKQYFPAIDGLRALAVLLVVLFHFDFEKLAGGFVGVDVFFVISGYLITRNIQSGIELKTFSFWGFYRSRIRRLYPALLATIAITLVVSMLLLSPDHLELASRSSISATLSVANLYFWSEAGYFDVDAIFKPLLHFWSLSVEEQYYLFWPAALVLILKTTKRRYTQALIFSVFLIASLFYTESLIHSEPSKAFYWFHARIYEFLIGAILVYFPKRNINNALEIFITILGISMILYSGMFYDKSTLFPGVSALLPCIGAALIILTRDSKSSRFFLANPVMVWLGKVSYSIYLVHWPIWVLYSYWKFDQISSIEKFFLGLLTLIIAGFMYYLVESKFRFNVRKNNNKFYLLTATSVISILVASALIISLNGLPSRIKFKFDTGLMSKINCELVENSNPKIKEKRCTYGSSSSDAKKILLLGDSHAGHLNTGLRRLGKEKNLSFESWTFSGCPPIWGAYKAYDVKFKRLSHKESHCKSLVSKWQKYVKENEFDLIILASRWALLTEPTFYTPTREFRRDFLVDLDSPVFTLEAARKTFKNKLAYTALEISNSKSKPKVIVIGQVPVLGKNIQGCDRVPKYFISNERLKKRCQSKVAYNDAMGRLNFTNDVIAGLESERILPILPSKFLCSKADEICKTVIKGNSVYLDDNHLNVRGSQYFIESIGSQILEFIE